MPAEGELACFAKKEAVHSLPRITGSVAQPSRRARAFFTKPTILMLHAVMWSLRLLHWPSWRLGPLPASPPRLVLGGDSALREGIGFALCDLVLLNLAAGPNTATTLAPGSSGVDVFLCVSRGGNGEESICQCRAASCLSLKREVQALWSILWSSVGFVTEV